MSRLFAIFLPILAISLSMFTIYLTKKNLSHEVSKKMLTTLVIFGIILFMIVSLSVDKISSTI